MAVSLFVIAVFDLILPNYKTSLMDQNKKMVREMTQIAWEMLDVAEKKERDGTLSREAAQKIALEHLRGMNYGEGALDYFWVNDLRPYMIMHPYRADLEGKDVSELVDPQGKFLFKEVVNLVQDHGEGFVTYIWQWNDDPNRIEQKLSFVKQFIPWGWVVGTGIYIGDVNQQIADLSRKMVMISSGIIFIVVLLTFYMTISSLQTAKKQMVAEAELKQHQSHLEKLVEERTTELTRSNTQLQEEIRERKKIEEQFFHASITDELTGLYNRRGFFEFAEKQLQIAQRQKNILYVLYMDLDGMKDINDRLGHVMGDRALVETADILTSFFRKSDIVCRLGGDEFVALTIAEKGATSGTAITHRLQEQFRTINSQAERSYELLMSVGALRYDHNAPCSVDELLSKADSLMYEQKKKSNSGKLRKV